MKKPIAFLGLLGLLTLSAQSATLIWGEGFENFDLTEGSLESQNPDWWTDPVNTDAIAVVSNSSYSAPGVFGGKSLVIGVTAPTGGTDPGVSWALSPSSASFIPTEPEVEATLSIGMMIGSSRSVMSDSFRISFADNQGNPLAAILLSPNAEDNRIVSVYRTNYSATGPSTFNTGALISVGTFFQLDFVINPGLNKWTGTLSEIGGSASFNLFANVDLTQNPGPPAPEQNLGSFAVDWLSADGGQTWGDNYLVMDNVSLVSHVPVPEPGVATLFASLALFGFLRRR